MLSRVVGGSTSGYYAWRKRSPSRRAQQNEQLSRHIARIHIASRGTCGTPRVHAELRAQRVAVSRPRVAELMRALRLQGVSRRRPRCATLADREAQIAPDRRDGAILASLHPTLPAGRRPTIDGCHGQLFR